ncbi:MAG TPA: hypothetical protein VFB15_08105 [Candidatus Binataceae bacterium]|nr:hypothetical protein [Candidatus Binataceae bacterium]
MAVVDALDTNGGRMNQEKDTLDERLPTLFEPDTLLPIQYFEAMRRKHLLEGEKRLILSVLEDAIECFMKCINASSSKGQRLFRDADEWIALEDKHWVFSFDNVCEMLDINPEYMRRGLREWKERKLAALEREAEARRQEAAAPKTAAADNGPVVTLAKPAEIKAVGTPKPVPSRQAQRKAAPARLAKSSRKLHKVRA